VIRRLLYERYMGVFNYVVEVIVIGCVRFTIGPENIRRVLSKCRCIQAVFSIYCLIQALDFTRVISGSEVGKESKIT